MAFPLLRVFIKQRTQREHKQWQREQQQQEQQQHQRPRVCSALINYISKDIGNPPLLNFTQLMIQLKNEQVSYSELSTAYHDCRKRKRRTENALQFEINDAENLYNFYLELNSGRYEIGESICFVVNKPVKREIFAADFRDRIIHHLVINRINPYLEKEFIRDSYSCRKGKGTSYAIRRCREQIVQATNNYNWKAIIVKGDLKSFFMTIDKDILYNMLDKFIHNNIHNQGEDFTLKLIRQIIYYEPQRHCKRKQSIKHWEGLPKSKSLFYCSRNKGLPIGNLTSQIFANFYLTVFDKFVLEVLGIRYYGRYVDDFFFIVYDSREVKAILAKMRLKLSEIGLTLHPNKLYIQEVRKGVKFVGAVIKPHRTYILNRTKGNMYYATQFNITSYMGMLLQFNAYRLSLKVKTML